MGSLQLALKRGLLLFNIVLVLYLCLSWTSTSPNQHSSSARDVIKYKATIHSLHNDTSVLKSFKHGKPEATPVADPPDPPLDSLERKMFPDLKECATMPLQPSYQQRGDYWVLQNYLPAAMSFRCDESITFTTHGDYTFLHNLIPITSRWKGPVSMALYAPGDDFNATINTILYLRDCWAEDIKKHVTFHLFFEAKHTPVKIPFTEELLKRKIDCGQEPPLWTNVTTYRRQNNLLYPVNVARNAARQAAQTYFVFPSDVELYPSINFIPEFFNMLKLPDISNTTKPRENVAPPETKEELVRLLKEKQAFPFHKSVCPKCHNIPRSKEWREDPIKPGLRVFHVSKRYSPYEFWEPKYMGTNKEPVFDERLSWEGKNNRIIQAYILCLLDYEFHILDNAFLVHRPGIKKVVTYDPSPSLGLRRHTCLQWWGGEEWSLTAHSSTLGLPDVLV
ncbi:hypothetical protein O3P69_003213 [Scylla paramamosain]|uniref:N-acetyllactosaminide beta-1,3-N-acetylglucosaminyltransferase n=1 Tax=Scylla paramamosain TaxID=85552 RepID=A0AAW0UMC5_SCYPA